MARGAFRSPTKNVQAVTEAWVKKHPNAKLIRVSSMPACTTDPEAILAFVWVVDGDENLNLELVRRGCFLPFTQTIGEGQKLEVSQTDYDAFANKVTQAGKYAQEHKLGGWGESAEFNDSDD
jgi:hypothetical protein